MSGLERPGIPQLIRQQVLVIVFEYKRISFDYNSVAGVDRDRGTTVVLAFEPVEKPERSVAQSRIEHAFDGASDARDQTRVGCPLNELPGVVGQARGPAVIPSSCDGVHHPIEDQRPVSEEFQCLFRPGIGIGSGVVVEWSFGELALPLDHAFRESFNHTLMIIRDVVQFHRVGRNVE